MGMFTVREPRRFEHKYIYVDERKEKLAKIEERAKRRLGMLPEKEFNPEDIRGDSWKRPPILNVVRRTADPESLSPWLWCSSLC